MLDEWSIAVLNSAAGVRDMGFPHTLIYRGYTVKWVGIAEDDAIKHDNDNEVFPINQC